jgi:hypothetical protein
VPISALGSRHIYCSIKYTPNYHPEVTVMRMPTIPYSRIMIEMINTIRNRMPSEFKPGVRFSNPDIFKNMLDFYHVTDDLTTKTLIESLLAEAGDNWLDLLKKSLSKENRQVIRVYRGHVSLVDAKSHIGIVANKKAAVEKRLYEREVIAS